MNVFDDLIIGRALLDDAATFTLSHPDYFIWENRILQRQYPKSTPEGCAKHSPDNQNPDIMTLENAMPKMIGMVSRSLLARYFDKSSMLTLVI